MLKFRRRSRQGPLPLYLVAIVLVYLDFVALAIFMSWIWFVYNHY